MKIPKEPPSWRDVLSSETETVFEYIHSSEIQSLVSRANKKCYHWDKVRHYKVPEWYSREMLWAAIKLSRTNKTYLDFYIEGDELSYWSSPEHLRLLHKIDQQASGTIGGDSALGVSNNADRFLFNSLMEEAIASSQLEGAATTREVAKKMLRQGRKPITKHEQMIFNNYLAMLEIRQLKDRQLTPEIIRDVQALLTDNTLEDNQQPGVFRAPEDPAVVVSDTITGEVIFTPPSAHSVSRLIDELCEFANEEQEGFIHPVLKAITIHFQLAYIHPFCDGNGRTARALFYWFMLHKGYWLFEFLPISRILLEGPVKYALSYLYTETDEADLTYFIHRNLVVIDRSLKDLHEYLSRQQTESKQAIELLRSSSYNTNYRQMSVISSALKKRTYNITIKEHATEFDITLATSRADLLGLESIGLLTKRKKGNKWVFFPAPNLPKEIGAITTQ